MKIIQPVMMLLMLLAWFSPAYAQPAQRADVEQVEKLIIERTNAFRKKHKLDPVKPDEHLTAAAEYFAKFMAETGKYGHTADDREPSERAMDHKYDYCIVLENIGYMFSTVGYGTEELAEGFVQGWIDSPGHRENMEDPDIVHIAVAVARDAKGQYYAVQMFGRPRTMAINFTITNESGQQTSYRLMDQDFDLPPRVRRTHTICRPAPVTFGWDGAPTHEPKDGAQLILRRDARGRFVVQTK